MAKFETSNIINLSAKLLYQKFKPPFQRSPKISDICTYFIFKLILDSKNAVVEHLKIKIHYKNVLTLKNRSTEASKNKFQERRLKLSNNLIFYNLII